MVNTLRDLIAPFLRPIAALIDDPSISEVMVVQTEHVFVEREGRVEAVPDIRLTEAKLTAAVKHIARWHHEDIGPHRPLLDTRLDDGSRVAIAMPPVSVDGITLTIRKFAGRRYTTRELVDLGTLTEPMLTSVEAAMAARENILISGGTTTGKTTMLNALTALLPRHEVILLIEDTAEIYLPHPHLVRFEAHHDDHCTVTIRDLVRASLRHRPDRLIIGEVRGAEAFDLLQALNSGHRGTLTTIHANSARTAVTRLASCVLTAGEHLPYEAILAHIADSIRYLLHLRRRDGMRYASELVRLDAYQFGTGQFAFTTLHTHMPPETGS
ncbi:MAG: CpaF family protein [Luteitalea sp.]|nr:CpaF family protein [Luteitalea sp.]